ncbi:Glycosyltransferase involved in cell wall bisynthesis [Maricaulis salignorans]|uniref:Glycosyltransferase involved in cell wall bisynthesis n=1 Tax=Maricaulis salignorans TaxID=144026 RepID=A0A1G9QQT1_9PROT|nr:Glycosyltransferase involved in cell wall bisynthesis [Maricaulis salignorans]
MPAGEAVLKLLVMSHAADRTGAPRSALLLAQEWVRLGLDVRILLRRDGVLRPEFEAVAPTDIYRSNPAFGLRDAGAMMRESDAVMALKCLRNPDRPYCRSVAERRHADVLADHYRGWGADAIYANTSHCADMIEQIGLNLPVLTHVREMAPSLLALDPRRRQHLVAGDGPVLAVSERGRVDLVEIGVAAARIAVEPPAAAVPDRAGLDAQRADVERELGLRPGDRLIASAGTVGSRKGADLFIDAVLQVLQPAPRPERIMAVWLGDGAWLEACRARVAEAGLAERILFPGAVADVTPVLRRAELLLCCSREDPYPRVLIEAALSGAPSIAFAGTGGAEEFIAEFDAGWLVPAFDTGAMAAQVRAALAARQGPDEALAGRVAGERSVQKSAARLLGHLNDLAGGTHGATTHS